MDPYSNQMRSNSRISKKLQDTPSGAPATLGTPNPLPYEPSAYPSSSLQNVHSASPTPSHSTPLMPSHLFSESILPYSFPTTHASHFEPHERYHPQNIYSTIPPPLSNMEPELPYVPYPNSLIPSTSDAITSDAYIYHSSPVISHIQLPSNPHPSPSVLKSVSKETPGDMHQSTKRKSSEDSSEHTYANDLSKFWQQQFQKLNEPNLDFKNHAMPLARVKKVMKSDPDSRISMISSEVPILLSKLSELFIGELTLRAWSIADELKRRTVQGSDIVFAAKNNTQYDFLSDILHSSNRFFDPEEPQDPIFSKYLHSSPQAGASPQLKKTPDSHLSGKTNHRSSAHPINITYSPSSELFLNSSPSNTSELSYISQHSSASREPYLNFSHSTSLPHNLTSAPNNRNALDSTPK